PPKNSLGLWNVRGQRVIQRIINLLKQYSLSAHIIKKSLSPLLEYFMEKADLPKTPSVRSFYFIDKDSSGQYTNTMVRNGKYWYFDNPKAINNKKAILLFKNFSTDNKITLIMVLIPPLDKTVYSDTKYYEELRNFLTDNEIRFIDLSFYFLKNR